MMKLDANDTKKVLRADLWSTMSLSELHKQREILVEELTRVRGLQLMPGNTQNPTILLLLSYLERGFQVITYLIDNYGQKKGNNE